MNDPTQLPSPRVPLQLSVEYKKNYARQADTGVLKNISLTGAFLENANTGLVPSDKITLLVNVAGRARRINASVIWTKSCGAGIMFHHFNNRDLQIIDDLIYFVESSRSKRRDLLETIFHKVS